jgi:hypothetical protein
MSVHDIPEDIRVKDLFHHIDMGSSIGAFV